MFFVPFIICIILSVNSVQPINGASNAEKTVPQTKNQSTETIFSEAGKITIDKPPSNVNNGSVNPAKQAEQMVPKPLAPTPSSTTESPRHRGIKDTDVEPTKELDSNITKNNTINSDKNTAINNTNQTSATVSHSQNVKSSSTTSKVGPIISTSIQNTQTKIDNSKKDLPSSKTVKTVVDAKANGTSTTATIKSTITTTTTKKPTTTTTTTTTTTKAPKKKPLITQSVEDVPGLLSKVAVAQSQSQLAKEQPTEDVHSNEPLLLQSSETISYPDQKSSHNFVMLIIGVIVIIPFLMLTTNYAVRRVRDYWSKRRYRRMDYLIEDMYN